MITNPFGYSAFAKSEIVSGIFNFVLCGLVSIVPALRDAPTLTDFVMPAIAIVGLLTHDFLILLLARIRHLLQLDPRGMGSYFGGYAKGATAVRWMIVLFALAALQLEDASMPTYSEWITLLLLFILFGMLSTAIKLVGLTFTDEFAEIVLSAKSAMKDDKIG